MRKTILLLGAPALFAVAACQDREDAAFYDERARAAETVEAGERRFEGFADRFSRSAERAGDEVEQERRDAAASLERAERDEAGFFEEERGAMGGAEDESGLFEEDEAGLEGGEVTAADVRGDATAERVFELSQDLEQEAQKLDDLEPGTREHDLQVARVFEAEAELDRALARMHRDAAREAQAAGAAQDEAGAQAEDEDLDVDVDVGEERATER